MGLEPLNVLMKVFQDALDGLENDGSGRIKMYFGPSNSGEPRIGDAV